MPTFAHSDVAFHLGLHCMLRQRLSSEKEMQLIRNVLPVTPYYTMSHPKFILLNQKEESIGI